MQIDLRMMKPRMINNLTTSSETDFLSYKMGKVLNDSKLDSTLKSYTLYVDSNNGDDSTADGTSSKPFKTITAAYNYLPDFVNSVAIKLKPGDYIETSSIQFYKNIVNFTLESAEETIAQITCAANDSRDSLIYVSNSHKITIDSIYFSRNDSSGTGSCINIDCTNFDISNCEFADASIAIKTSCCNGQIDSCSFENLYNAINANKASNILSTNNETIDNVDYGIISNGSIVFNYGNDLTGDVEDYITTMYGRVFNTDREVAVASVTDSNGNIVNRGGTEII